uniref:MENTAL domain-containing protein n=1 Tax=Globodera rostochiensis TaxID=31243 RepID=A0A914HR93_GLORO
MNEMPPTLPLPLHAEVVFLIILIIEHNPSALLLHNREPGRHEQGPYKNSSLEAFVEKVDIFRPYFLYNSLFDLAIAAFLRMSVLLVAYALIKCDHCEAKCNSLSPPSPPNTTKRLINVEVEEKKSETMPYNLPEAPFGRKFAW